MSDLESLTLCDQSEDFQVAWSGRSLETILQKRQAMAKKHLMGIKSGRAKGSFTGRYKKLASKASE